MKEIKKNKSRSRNALVHGLYAKDILLPWDSKDEFERLHAELKVEFMPHGRAEEETILDLALLHWQKHTLWRMRQTAVLKDPFTQDILETERKSWSGIRKRLRSRAKSERTVLGAFAAEQAKMFSEIAQMRNEMEAASDEQEVRLITEKIGSLLRMLRDHGFPILQASQQGPNAEQAFDSTYDPEGLEKIVRLEALLDARIAKVLARLVGLKEFKRMPAAGTTTMMLPAVQNR